jgi:ABC-2 type transport system ATP-binding protein
MPTAFAIQTKDLTKRYDTHTALDRISFDVRPGEIMGFLGPNGAGKTTTMRILTGLLAPTSGTATIDGLDIETHSLDARRRLGYLPENVALYPELRVQEFLAYRAAIKGVPGGERRARVSDAMGRCGLADVQRKLIGKLSKGYRQRVGLADCLLGKPSILVLDEPTVGLDPAQIRQTRELIKELGRSTTILLSTHILTEVEMLCSRVTIITRGRIVAADTPDNLRHGISGAVRVELRGSAIEIEQALRQLKGVAQVRREPAQGDATAFLLDAAQGVDLREAIFQLAVQRGWTLRELTRAQATLEEVFIHLTMRETDARDAEDRRTETRSTEGRDAA